MHEYTPEQVTDIEGRQNKAMEQLKELELFPAAHVMKVNMGDDVFADKLLVSLQDTKYAKKEAAEAPVVDAEIVAEVPTVDPVNPQPEA